LTERIIVLDHKIDKSLRMMNEQNVKSVDFFKSQFDAINEKHQVVMSRQKDLADRIRKLEVHKSFSQ